MTTENLADPLIAVAVHALEDIKGKDITVLDVRHLTSLFDTMIIACGDSTRQVKALAVPSLQRAPALPQVPGWRT